LMPSHVIHLFGVKFTCLWFMFSINNASSICYTSCLRLLFFHPCNQISFISQPLFLFLFSGCFTLLSFLFHYPFWHLPYPLTLFQPTIFAYSISPPTFFSSQPFSLPKVVLGGSTTSSY
jgi:hypothetical protein